MQTAKTDQIGRMPGWSESSLGAHHFIGFVMRRLNYCFNSLVAYPGFPADMEKAPAWYTEPCVKLN